MASETLNPVTRSNLAEEIQFLQLIFVNPIMQTTAALIIFESIQFSEEPASPYTRSSKHHETAKSRGE